MFDVMKIGIQPASGTYRYVYIMNMNRLTYNSMKLIDTLCFGQPIDKYKVCSGVIHSLVSMISIFIRYKYHTISSLDGFRHISYVARRLQNNISWKYFCIGRSI
jgi:hypothetical protein